MKEKIENQYLNLGIAVINRFSKSLNLKRRGRIHSSNSVLGINKLISLSNFFEVEEIPNEVELKELKIYLLCLYIP